MLRIATSYHAITGMKDLITILRKYAPFPPPHPMILGTLNGHLLRKMAGIDSIGREITLPPPHLTWHDVPPERWPATHAEAHNLALTLETHHQNLGRPGFYE